MAELNEFRPSRKDIEDARRSLGGYSLVDRADQIIEVSLDEVGDIEDTQAVLFEEVGSRSILAEQITQVLNALSRRERFVLDYRYGLMRGRQYTLREIGIKLGMQERGKPLTKERIRQIESEALHKLRRPDRELSPTH